MEIVKGDNMKQSDSHTNVDLTGYRWLEDNADPKVRKWVKNQTSKTRTHFMQGAGFDAMKERFLDEYRDTSKIPAFFFVSQQNGYYYVVEQSSENPLGILQRIAVTDFSSVSRQWEQLLDIDLLAENEGTSWFVNLMYLRVSPSGERAIIPFTIGGEDAATLREFDLVSKEFVKDGFQTPNGKSSLVWEDDDTLVIAIALTDEEKTVAGSSRVVRRWERGTQISSAEIIYRASKESVMLVAAAFETATRCEVIVLDVKTITDFSCHFLKAGADAKRLHLPPMNLLHASVGLTGVGDHLIFSTMDSFEANGASYKPGQFFAINFDDLLQMGPDDTLPVQSVFSPQGNETVSAHGGIFGTSEGIYLNVLSDAAAKLVRLNVEDNGDWASQTIALPHPMGTLSLPWSHDPKNKSFVARFETVLEAPVLLRITREDCSVVQRETQMSNFAEYDIEQNFAPAEDGTNIPYFIVQKNGQERDGTSRVLIYAYGGFGVSTTPQYDYETVGPLTRVWLEEGGVLVLPGVRGGGEYGPDWHRAGKGRNKPTTYNDIYAVAEHVIDQGISAHGLFAFIGASNGGLTASVVATQRPDMFGASVAVVPLTDMELYHKLFNGAIWMDEYGSPEIPADWEILRTYSPLHNVHEDVEYPKMLLMTSTKDDRVHPAHARKLARRLQDLGHDAWLFETPEGGHTMAVDDVGRAENSALQLAFLKEVLGL
ncbi:prolyl oligopeptidase family serine peptidase [Parasphingorhabdus sp.]|uniref:prolyl oligopeptidase family serine peptidase n=1 Tax=Parasphingorhabdus sp. TaxID=2709688 RepID=UPI0032EB3E74